MKCKQIRRSDRRRPFLMMLTKQLAVPNIEERALNNRIVAYPRIRNAVDAFDVKILSRPTEAEAAAPPFAPRGNRPSCRLCRSEYGRQRKTRSYCNSCNNPVCAEHSTLMHRCNTCTESNLDEGQSTQQ